METVYRIFVESLAGSEVTICFAKTKRLANRILKEIPTAKLCEEKLYTSLLEFQVDA